MDIINSEDLYRYSGKIKDIINNIANEIVRGVLEEKDGPQWFDKLIRHMKNYSDKNKDNYIYQYANAYKLENYRSMDITICFYIFTKDSYYSRFFRFEKNVFEKIVSIKEARNSLSHGEIYLKDIDRGIIEASDTLDLLHFYYEKYFTDSLTNDFKKRINELQKEMDMAKVGVSHVNSSKKIRYVVASIIGLIVILSALAISNFMKGDNSAKKSTQSVQNNIESSENTSSGNASPSTEEMAKEIIDAARSQIEGQQNGNNSSNQAQQGDKENKAAQSAENRVLDFSDKPRVQQLTGSFSVGVEKIEFNADNTVLYLHYNNQYSGDIRFKSVRLDVGNETADMDWMHGAAALDKMLGVKESTIKLVLPKVDYSEEGSIVFMSQIYYAGSNGNEGLEMLNKSINININ